MVDQTREELERIFGEAHAAVDQAKARALALLEARSGLTNSSEPEWVPMKAAAMDHGCTVETMTRHVIDFGLGVKVGGRWQVDRRRVSAWRNNEPYERLRTTADHQFDVLRGSTE